jgi:hypothetical protein
MDQFDTFQVKLADGNTAYVSMGLKPEPHLKPEHYRKIEQHS